MYVYIARNIHQYVTSVQYYYLTHVIESFFRIPQCSINYLYILSDIFYIFFYYTFLVVAFY
jgi:inhibitor of KinA sporulation pathway (predicted exonuclease)